MSEEEEEEEEEARERERERETWCFTPTQPKQLHLGKRERQTDRRTTLHKIASFNPKCTPNVRTLSPSKGVPVRAISLSKSLRAVER